MSLPHYLLTEVRHAFRTCPRYNYCPKSRQLTTYRPLYKQRSVQPSVRKDNESNSSQEQVKNLEKSLVLETDSEVSLQNGALITRHKTGQNIQNQQSNDVPLKVIPNQDLTPNLRISPRERLHIEAITRRAPKTAVKNVYKEKLLIYHFGTAKEKMLVLLKVTSMFAASFVTVVVVPAHLVAGTSWWLVGLFFMGGLLPFGIIQILTSSWVTRVFLHLPPYARQSPKTAMEYARNLPASATLDIEFLRPVPFAGKLTANVNELAPAHQWWRMESFKWVGRMTDKDRVVGSPPSGFFVKPESSKGKAARFTIPGIWSVVYRRLVDQNSDYAVRWKKS